MSATDRKDIPFAAGVVGSLPRPQAVVDMLPDDPGEESAEASRSPQMNAAVSYAIAMQETAGLDQVSDGEWRRHAYTHIIADVATGFSPDNRESPHRWGITVTEPMEVRRRGLVADEARFLVESTDRMTKVCLPSPYLLGVRLWEKEWSSRAYPTRDEFIDALVPILHDELVALQATGVSVVQIDEPHLCVLVDPKTRAEFDDPQYEMDLAAAKINEVIHGVDGVRLAIHLCRRNWGRSGWGAEGGYGPIVETLKKIKVDQYVMEFSIPAAGDVAILKEMPEDSLIGLGSVECRFEHVDTPEEIVARVEEALKYVEPERISLNPDCGFSPGKQAYAPLDEAYSKLKNEAEAARRLREKYA
ncbi:MAG: cobalamin-independent methionine synthase II family protein [Chloroflexi bacterium]|nr:cobalamin-independent methionine synthase II family protein [Chloroflexota bacterium]